MTIILMHFLTLSIYVKKKSNLTKIYKRFEVEQCDISCILFS